MKQVEIFILSGFLGSGKTTLLKNILREEQMRDRKIAVVMNELGQVSIDSDSIPDNTPFKELLNGCVCCTIQGQFETQLHSMLQQYELDAVYIETTGAAHPIEVLDACLSPSFANQVVVKGIISLVDAKRWQSRDTHSIQIQRLMLEQIIHADIILLNKLDGLSEGEKASILHDIQSLNNRARCIMTEYAKINMNEIYNVQLQNKQQHEQAHVQKNLHLKTYVHEFKNPVNRDVFEEWLRQAPDKLYRLKGYIRFTDAPNRTMSIQYSYGVPIYLPEILKVPMTIVLIGEELDHTTLQKQFHEIENS
ncbi:GTP-binding protein [Bacillus sp. HMF5848]|uniref:CobW family GTP-binding protein n=1 Tax=Bacillus sp. HMF5848 TaxID=2495421 RepID=UPI000F77C63F|nr:GTP-binding protein [Bacillus sp. HMF5848]RSK27343.1 GTP-binding protein [Bacillus sp. HMF5848]